MATERLGPWAERRYEDLRRRVEQEIRLARSRPVGICPACGAPLLRDDEQVIVDGLTVHAGCASWRDAS
jgi:hypothetical protein